MNRMVIRSNYQGAASFKSGGAVYLAPWPFEFEVREKDFPRIFAMPTRVWPVLALLAACQALQLPARVRARAHRAPVLRAAEGGPDADGDEGLSLEAAFQARLAKEGGATQFKLRTDAARAADEAKGSLESLTSKVSKSVSGLLDLGSGRPAADGLLDQKQWNATVAFFVLLIALSVGNALFNAPPDGSFAGGGSGTVGIDTFTSDGGGLQFGKRN